MYKISIIVPVFNVGNLLYDAFESIKNQTIGFENLEVLFIDDCSTDNSREIISNFANMHDNVKSFFLNENSGYAGRPRNVGLEHATSDYIMFLDPDDAYFENACELLYDSIKEKNIDMVSGNFIGINQEGKTIDADFHVIKLKENDNLFVEKIDENPKLLLTLPSLWTKIFKKSFIEKNNIRFMEGVPAQDLIFIDECLINANGILYINKPIVDYFIRSKGESKSISANISKKNLNNYLKAFNRAYEVLHEYNVDYGWYAIKHMYFWSRQFLKSNLSMFDKVDLLENAKFLYDEFNKSPRLNPPIDIKIFYELIFNNKLYEAANFASDYNYFLNKDKREIDAIVRKKEIIISFNGLEEKLGGLPLAIFNRAKLLSDNGYSVTILNLNPYRSVKLIYHFDDYDKIINYCYESGYLNKDIKFFNILNYYRDKNTLDPLDCPNLLDESLKKSKKFYINQDYVIRKISKSSTLTRVTYYNKSDFNDSELEFIINHDELKSRKEVIFEELYKENILVIRSYYKNNTLIKEELLTNDGFNYCTYQHQNVQVKILLNDREFNISKEFHDIHDFSQYFIREMCLNASSKPILINDSSGLRSTIEDIDPEIAYKINVLHSNPYNKPYCLGADLKDISTFHNMDKTDSIVVLTNRLKKDLIKEFKTNKIYAIPNIILFNKENNIEPNSIQKNREKISIFARISPEKNISDAIKALNIVLETHPNVKLNIFGRAVFRKEKKEYEKLVKLVKELKIEENVIFRGHVENVSYEMQNSYLSILSSEYEGMPLTILESMLNGTPVISYDINYGPSDIITNDKDGIIVEQFNIHKLADAINTLLDDPDKVNEMSKEAVEKINTKFSHDKILKLWQELFEQTYINAHLRKYEDIINKDKDLKNKDIKLKNNNRKYKKELRNKQTVIDYYKLKSSFKKKILFLLPYLYILFKSRKNMRLNIKFYRSIKDNDWFDIGYYLNENTDLKRDKWCKLLTPETHYTCFGHDENRKPNKNYKKLTKQQIIEKLAN